MSESPAEVRVSLVIPVKNEEASIARLIDFFRRTRPLCGLKFARIELGTAEHGRFVQGRAQRDGLPSGPGA